MRQRTRAVIGSLAAALALTLSGAGVSAQAQDYWQCAYFARLFSGIQIRGDAWTWWGQAAGKYARGNTPQEGAVLVFKPTSRMKLGHVSVVSDVITDRVIQVTHANWSRINGTRGQIEKNVTVVDVSPRGDWTEVKVWYDSLGDLGTSTYPTHGFVYRNAMQQAPNAAINAAFTVARTAANHVASAVQPSGNSPMQTLARASADSGDRIAALIAQVTGGGEGADSNK